MIRAHMSSALATDLYQLTMMAGYWTAGLTGTATFELFVRRLPPDRGYLLAAGLDQALGFLESVRFDEADRAALAALPQFAQVDPAWFDDYLARFRFSGDVWAIAEGTPVFAQEPLLRVTAPLPEAQLVETALLATLSYQTSVATKASRAVAAAGGRAVIEFGARRAHGLCAAFDAARAAFIGGCAGTSYVDAAVRLGIPATGTMAHSWVQAFADEDEAFREFSRVFPGTAVYLLDTYDTIAAARRLAQSGLKPPAVRLDSGDLVELSRAVRRILDEAGLTKTTIFATSDLDEYRIADLLAAGAPIDGFGVGTSLTTVVDAPALSAVYKLVAIERHGAAAGVIKLSPGKHTWPGAKQVWRVVHDGVAVEDVVAAADEPPIDGAQPLMSEVMRGGRRLEEQLPIVEQRRRCRSCVDALPDGVRRLRDAESYPVRVSDTLEARRRAIEAGLD